MKSRISNSDEAAILVAMIIRYVDAHESEEKSGQKKITEQGIARSLTYYALEAIMTCWLHLPRSWYYLECKQRSVILTWLHSGFNGAALQPVPRHIEVQ